MKLRQTAQQLFPGVDIKLRENKQASRIAKRPAWDIIIRIPGTSRGKHVATLIITGDSMIYSPPQWYFVPSESVPHPETLQPVIEAGIAYSIAAFQQRCDSTGIDTVQGFMLDLEAARAARRAGDVHGFVILQSEEKA